jgi:hypothetical protein
MNKMEVEEFIINICLTHCLQQMEYFQGQRPEEPEAAGRAPRSESAKAEQHENMQEVHLKKIEMKSKTTSKDLLDGPLVLDQQCIMDLFAIKRQFCNTSNNEIIMVALKMGLNQLSVALDMFKHKLKE